MLPDTIRWMLAAFATYRLAVLFTIDDGPGDIFRHWRERMGVYELGADGRPESGTGRLAGCPYCVAAYTAGLCALLAATGWWVSDLVLAWLGLWGAQSALQGRRDPQ